VLFQFVRDKIRHSEIIFVVFYQQVLSDNLYRNDLRMG